MSSPSELLHALSWRYATKRFDAERTIPADVWSALEDTLVLSPSSFGLQLWKFYVVNNPEIRKELRAHSWNQPQVVEASHLVVFATKDQPGAQDVDAHIRNISAVRGAPEQSLSEYKGMMLSFVKQEGFDATAWATRQVYIALGFFLLSCASLGVDACPMEGIDSGAYDRILGVGDEGYRTVVAAAAGYRAPTDGYASAKKVRYAKDSLIAYR